MSSGRCVCGSTSSPKNFQLSRAIDISWARWASVRPVYVATPAPPPGLAAAAEPVPAEAVVACECAGAASRVAATTPAEPMRLHSLFLVIT